MNDEKDELTPDEAIALLPEGDEVHTFIQSGAMLIGADWPRGDVVELITARGGASRSGPMATSMSHGLVVERSGDRPLFIETREEKE